MNSSANNCRIRGGCPRSLLLFELFDLLESSRTRHHRLRFYQLWRRILCKRNKDQSSDVREKLDAYQRRGDMLMEWLMHKLLVERFNTVKACRSPDARIRFLNYINIYKAFGGRKRHTSEKMPIVSIELSLLCKIAAELATC